MRSIVNCPACGRRFEAITGSECFCKCDTRFRVVGKSGALQVEVIPRELETESSSRLPAVTR